MKKYTIGIPWSGCELKSDIPVTSEQEAVAIACGMQLGGAKCKVFMQDSGWLNCCNNIFSLAVPYEFELEWEVKEVNSPSHHYYTNLLYKEINDKIISY